MKQNLPLRVVQVVVLGGIVLAFILPLFSYLQGDTSQPAASSPNPVGWHSRSK